MEHPRSERHGSARCHWGRTPACVNPGAPVVGAARIAARRGKSSLATSISAREHSAQDAVDAEPGVPESVRRCRSLGLRPPRVHGVGEAEEDWLGSTNFSFCVARHSLRLQFRLVTYHLAWMCVQRSQLIWPPSAESYLHPEHPRTLSAGRRSRGEQGERDEQCGPSCESHHRLSSSFFFNAPHAARCVACHGVRSHADPRIIECAMAT
jgi:hypothetical protein